MPADTETLPLTDDFSSSGVVAINGHCHIVEGWGMRVVMYAGIPVLRMAPGDERAEDLFIAQALENCYAKPGELAEALGRPLRTIHRVHERYVKGGLSGLAHKKPGPKGPRLGETREAAIRRWHGEGTSISEMAHRLGVSWATVREALRRMGLADARNGRQQEKLWATEPSSGDQSAPTGDQAVRPGEVATGPEPPGGDGEAVAPAGNWDLDPMNRSVDRMLAACGQLDDAAPIFGPARAVPRGGVLLAVPLLVASGMFDAAHKTFGTIGPAFYGLRTILLVLLFLGLLRIKRPENVKEYSPPDLGRLLGLDRAPEVKTIRRKLGRLASAEGALECFIDALVRRRVERTSEALGYLYVDGHVRVYNGKVDLPKAHVARMRLSAPATQDVWVNDAQGDPVFFMTQEAHPQLVGAMSKVLKEVRKLVGDRRLTVVFDRGGWSPELFRKMDKDGFDVLTYRKGKADPMPEDRFVRHIVSRPQGTATYDLCDEEVEVKKGFWMRQVTRKKDDHQTHIVTTRRDLAPTEVATRMFDRWRQENFFKYMRTEFAIDALVEYGTETAEKSRLVPNPERKEVEQEVRKAKAEVARLEAAYGKAASENPESQRPTMRGFKIAHGTEIGIPLREARLRLDELTAQRRTLPTRVPVGKIKDVVVRLRTRRKQLSDALKMLAYQTESDLVRAVGPQYHRSLDEGRRLIRTALLATADIEPIGDELRVTLAPQSSPHRTRAIAELCALLNDTDTRFPGTELRLRYAIHGADCAK